MPFYEALKQLMTGKASAIRRTSWESGVTVSIQDPKEMDVFFNERFLYIRIWKSGQKTRQIPWEPGYESIFANDWECEHNFEA